MRIGILTLPLHTNYGGILQAYALQTVLERMGHEVRVINKSNYYLPLWKIPFVYAKRILKNLNGDRFPIFYEQQILKEIPIIGQYTNEFIDKYIHTLDVKNYSYLKESDFDAIVVGSDQVWRPKYFGKIEDAYLDFAKTWNIKRIAYAASFGTDKWEYSVRKTKKCCKLVRKFDAVSVREISGIDLCKDYFGITVEHVLDPTMLLSKDDYIQFFNINKIPKSNGNLLSYILDETLEKQLLIDEIAENKGLIPFRVNSKVEDRSAPLAERIQPPVEQWIRGFYDAEFIVTDSFHACVFSIIFNKPFLVIGNQKRGLSRILSLLTMLKLEDRMINGSDYDYICKKKVEWNTVNALLKDKVYFSMKFISNNFNYGK